MEKDEYAAQPLMYRWTTRPIASKQHPQRTTSTSRLHLWSWLLQTFVFAASALTLFLAQSRSPNTLRCVEKLSTPSPALDAVSDEYQWRRFDGKVTDGSSLYRGRPTPERVAAWRNITFEPTFRIDHSALRDIGGSQDSVRASDGEGYVAWLEVYHHIHCVEQLWKNTWPEFYDEDAGDEGTVFRKHLDHCADLLRQKLMCDSDVSLITYNWVEHLSHPTPNFNVLHQCRNFEKVREWTREHQIAMPKTKPSNAVELSDFP